MAETLFDYLVAFLIALGLIWTLDVMWFGFDRPGLFT